MLCTGTRANVRSPPRRRRARILRETRSLRMRRRSAATWDKCLRDWRVTWPASPMITHSPPSHPLTNWPLRHRFQWVRTTGDGLAWVLVMLQLYRPIRETGPRPWTRKREESSPSWLRFLCSWYNFGKIINTVATRCHVLKLKCTKLAFGRGSPRPHGWI